MERSRGLDGGALKLIAAALMLTDHVGSILLPQVLILRCIGRLAFPVFAFFIAEGYARTHNFWKYLLRMAVVAAIAEVPFDLTGGSIWDPDRQNVLLTFCIALLALRGLDELRRWDGAVRYLGAAAGFAAGQLLRVDYGGWGVLTVALFYLCRDGKYAKLWLLAGMAALNGVCIGSMKAAIFGAEVPIQVLAVLALPLIWTLEGIRALT